MLRFITPIILIVISGAIFFVVASPVYNDISRLKDQVSVYNDALTNSKKLENERDKLTAKYNAIDPNNLMKLEKLLPDNVSNIRLILEIEQIAVPYGMNLKNVKYNVEDKKKNGPTSDVAVQGDIAANMKKDYGVFDLEFSTSGTYNNFLSFTKDLEKNLRIVDISSVAFSSDSSGLGVNPNQNSDESYQYDFKIKTYWLKN